MSETAAAPAATPAPIAATTAPVQAANAAPDDSNAPPAEAAWDNEQEAQFLKMLQKSPYGKLKANGKEETLDSAEKLKAVLLDATRGRGAKQVVEAANKEKAEAAKAKEEAALLRKALHGDAAARKALGYVDPAEAQAKEQALSEIPPEVRALYEELEATKATLAERDAEREQLQKAEEERRTTAQREQVRTEALGFAKSLTEQLGSGDDAQQVLPYVLQAWHVLTSEGLQANVDVMPEHVITLARQMFEEEGVGRVEKLAPKSFLGAALKRLESMPVKDVVAGLSPKMRVAIAKELAQQRVAAKTQAQPKPAEPQSSRPSTAALPQPMSPFRFGR